MGALSNQLSKLGPLEDTSRLSQCSRLSSSCSLTPPHALHSSSSSSFTGPCETDESRGFSQYDIRSQFSSNGSRSLFPSPRDQHHSPTGSTESQLSQPSVPTEDQYPPLTGPLPGPDTEGRTTARLYGVPECISPGGSLLSSSPETSGTSAHCSKTQLKVLFVLSLVRNNLFSVAGIVNPIPQKDLPGEARIQTADDLCTLTSDLCTLTSESCSSHVLFHVFIRWRGETRETTRGERRAGLQLTGRPEP